MSDLPIHFITIVLNGQPFIRYHLDRMNALRCPWHWHIIEGMADLAHDGAWALKFGGELPGEAVRDGRSIDGTAEYLDEIASQNPARITLYRAPGHRRWDGKLEMVSAPLANLPEECLLWQVDSDELWTTEQFTRLRDLFLQNPQRTSAVFFCDFFVGPNLAINRRRPYPQIEWRRAWRYQAGMKWFAHEPPILAAPAANGRWIDLATQNPFTPQELEADNLVFQHFAYVTAEQLAFKESAYGYKGITNQWRRLQQYSDFPVPLKQFFNWPWVNPNALVDPLDICGIVPLAHIEDRAWILDPPAPPAHGLAALEADPPIDRLISRRKLGYHVLPRLIEKHDLKIGAIVGLATGGQARAILERTHATRLRGVDPFVHRDGDRDIAGLPQSRLDLLCQAVQRDMARYGERFELLRATSQDAAGRIPDAIDFVFLDGDPSPEGIQRDLHTWFPKIRDDGIIAGYGFNHPDFPSVAPAVREFITRENLVFHREEEHYWWVRKIPVSHRRPALFVNPVGAAVPAEKHGRGVLFVKWGDKVEELLQRAIGSVRAVHPELPIHVHVLPDNSTLLDKAGLYDFSPFQETLFLDLDTVMLGRVDFGFEMAQRHGLACCICENPWARRYGGLSGDLIEYNTGVLFFTERAKPIFDNWAALARSIDSSTRYVRDGQVVSDPSNDQAAFALAVSQSPAPAFVLPPNWNYRPKWYRVLWGPIKIWHDARPIPVEILNWTRAQAQPDAIIQCTRFEKLCP
jgi:hypothetical protein